MSSIPDFTEAARWVASSTLKARYGAGKEWYGNLRDCVIALLWVQAARASTGMGGNAFY